VNFIDTANVYAFGQAETTLGQSLKNLSIARKDLVMATKFSSREGPGRNDVGASRGHIMHSLPVGSADCHGPSRDCVRVTGYSERILPNDDPNFR
jgi:diketogulonate reductase-like aldo/keto reductase